MIGSLRFNRPSVRTFLIFFDDLPIFVIQCTGQGAVLFSPWKKEIL
jgi:hypothetical protein